MNIVKLTIIYILILVAIIAMVNQGGYIDFITQFVHSIPYGDKVGHFVLMGFLSFVVNLSFKGKKFSVLGLPVLIGSFLVFVGVTLEELSQIFVPARTFDMGDLLFDYLGIFLFGQAAWYLTFRKFNKTPSHKS